MNFTGAGADLPTIYLPSEASNIEMFAAQELQNCLQRMTGKTLPMVLGERPREPYLFVGTRDAFGAYHDPAETDELEKLRCPEAFWMRMKPNRLDMVGEAPAGALAAVYQFLECCGVRWFEPGPEGELLPRCSQLQFSDAEQRSEPLVGVRGLVNATSAEAVEWMARNRLNMLILEHSAFLNARDLLERETEKRGIGIEILSGCLSDWIGPGDGVFDDPACAAQTGGRPGTRSKEHCALCSSNSKVREAAAQGIARFLEAHPRVRGISFNFGDDLRRCECESCQKSRELDPREVPRVDSLSGRFNGKARLISEGVWEIFGDLLNRLGDAARGRTLRIVGVEDSFYLPRNPKLPRNAGCLLQLKGRCYRHALNGTECLANQCLWQPLELWVKRAKGNIVIYDRFDGPEDYLGMLFPAARLLGADLLILHHLGVSAVVTDARWHRSTINSLNLWTFARQAWFGEGTVDAAFNDFFPRYYGSAAGPVRDFFRIWHSRWLDFRGCFLGRGMDILRLLGFDEFAEAQERLESALDASGTTRPFQARIQREMAFFQLASHVWSYLESVTRLASFRQAGLTEQAGAQERLVQQRRAALLSFASTLDGGSASYVEKASEVWPRVIQEAVNQLRSPGDGDEQ
jgi:hypothetical protein